MVLNKLRSIKYGNILHMLSMGLYDYMLQGENIAIV
jgi:hypothetical protein